MAVNTTERQVPSGAVTRTHGLGRVSVVGTASALKAADGTVGLVTLPPDGDHVSVGAFILTGSAPVTWEQVQRLNEHGLVVVSRAVLADPPGPVDRIAGTLPSESATQGATRQVLLMLAGVGAVVVAGRRSRRSAARGRRVRCAVRGAARRHDEASAVKGAMRCL